MPTIVQGKIGGTDCECLKPVAASSLQAWNIRDWEGGIVCVIGIIV